jgi:hypothetical protein
LSAAHRHSPVADVEKIAMAGLNVASVCANKPVIFASCNLTHKALLEYIRDPTSCRVGINNSV